jgi:hypothetical protein
MKISVYFCLDFSARASMRLRILSAFTPYDGLAEKSSPFAVPLRQLCHVVTQRESPARFVIVGMFGNLKIKHALFLVSLNNRVIQAAT